MAGGDVAESEDAARRGAAGDWRVRAHLAEVGGVRRSLQRRPGRALMVGGGGKASVVLAGMAARCVARGEAGRTAQQVSRSMVRAFRRR